MITAAQIRGARAMIGLTVDEISAATGLSISAIQNAEHETGTPDRGVTTAIAHVLEARGIVFFATGDDGAGGPGIRLRARSDKADDGTRPENLNATNDG